MRAIRDYGYVIAARICARQIRCAGGRGTRRLDRITRVGIRVDTLKEPRACVAHVRGLDQPALAKLLLQTT